MFESMAIHRAKKLKTQKSSNVLKFTPMKKSIKKSTGKSTTTGKKSISKGSRVTLKSTRKK